MLRIMGSERQFCDGVTRREMLQVGTTKLPHADVNCILLML